MIDGLSIISLIDINNRNHMNTNISNLFKELSNRLEKIESGIEVRFNPSEILAKDLFGWTEVNIIRKISNNLKWYKIESNNNSVILSENQQIPVYDKKYSIGFHGETKYSFELKFPNQISEKDFIRSNSRKFEFHNCIITELDESPQYGYEINTKSKFINVNNIYLYSI